MSEYIFEDGIAVARVCSKCGIQKPLSEFYRAKRHRGGYHTWCKECSNASRARSREREDVEERRARDRRRYQREKDRWFEYNILRRYGISLEFYQEMVERQEGKCAICGEEPDGETNQGRLHVDHDHNTQRVRGLLCGSCNSGLGYFRDSPRLLKEAATYLGDDYE